MAKFEKILVLNNEVEAHLLDALLKEKGIPHLMQTYHDRAYDGLWQPQRGWGHVEAPGTYREQVLSIYNDLKSDDQHT